MSRSNNKVEKLVVGANDNYVVDPVALGEGKTMFDGIKDKLPLELKKTRTFGNGNVLLRYEPMA